MIGYWLNANTKRLQFSRWNKNSSIIYSVGVFVDNIGDIYINIIPYSRMVFHKRVNFKELGYVEKYVWNYAALYKTTAQCTAQHKDLKKSMLVWYKQPRLLNVPISFYLARKIWPTDRKNEDKGFQMLCILDSALLTMTQHRFRQDLRCFISS